MKKVLLFLLLVLLTAACDRADKALTLHNDYALASYEMTKSPVNEDMFSFDKVKEQWSTYKSLSEMFAAAMMPESLAEQMSTEALLRITLSHPLKAMYVAYNNEVKGIKVICENFNGVQVLCAREDAEETLLKALSDTSLPEFEAGFIELLLGSELIKFRNPLLKELYGEIINARIKFIESHPEDYSFITIRRTLHLQAYVDAIANDLSPDSEEIFEKIAYGETPVLTKAPGDIIGYCTVYTQYGQPVQGILLQEMTASQISYYNQEAQSEFPNATLISPSSFRYNCHSYAWNMSEGGQTCWINAGPNYSNLSAFWIYDAFTQTSASGAERIVYSNDDHSALPSPYNSSKFISKWGSWPVMEHVPTYCPYVSTSLKYYSDDSIPNHIYRITGEDLASLNQSYIYTPLNAWSNLTIGDWTILNHHEMPIGYNYNMLPGGSISVTFTTSGEYTITCGYYFNGIRVGTGYADNVLAHYDL